MNLYVECLNGLFSFVCNGVGPTHIRFIVRPIKLGPIAFYEKERGGNQPNFERLLLEVSSFALINGSIDLWKNGYRSAFQYSGFVIANVI